MTKRFDCVNMKDSIQGAMLRQIQSLSAEQERAWVEDRLAHSDSVAARLWRRLSAKREPASRVAETHAPYPVNPDGKRTRSQR